MNKTVIIFSHTYFKDSKINKALLQSVKYLPNIEIRNLEELYGNDAMNIDVKKEQEILQNAKRIVFQFPMFWFLAPAMLKAYMDEVFTYNWAYGNEARALQNKEFIVAISTGATKEMMQERTKNDLSKLWFAFELSANFCNMKFNKSFMTFGATSIDDKAIKEQAEKYKQLLEN